MGKARNRAERTGDMDVVIGTTKLVPDASGDLEVKDASNNRKKVIASEIKLGTGNDVVIIKRNWFLYWTVFKFRTNSFNNFRHLSNSLANFQNIWTIFERVSTTCFS
mgnify:CR=1 FL=1